MVHMKELCLQGAGGGECGSSGGTLMMLPDAGQNTVVLKPGSRLGKCPANTRRGERGKRSVGGLEGGREWGAEEMREGRKKLERGRDERGEREREGGGRGEEREREGETIECPGDWCTPVCDLVDPYQISPFSASLLAWLPSCSGSLNNEVNHSPALKAQDAQAETA